MRGMAAMIDRGEFKPDFVFIPTDAVPHRGGAVDPDDCTLLMLDSSDGEGWLFTREQWEADDGEPELYRHSNRGPVTADDGELDGEVIMLPDAWLIKVDETEYFCPEVLQSAKRVFSIYAIDRNEQVHLCEFKPSYARYFIDYDFEWADDFDTDNDDAKEAFYRLLDEAKAAEEPIGYVHCGDVEPISEIKAGFQPEGNVGGYKWETKLVRMQDIVDEISEASSGTSL